MHLPPRSRSRVLAILGLLGIAAAATDATAQCSTQWAPGDGAPGANGPVYSLAVWDADGSGPASPVVVVGGNFLLAGTQATSSIATFDPVSSQWAPLDLLFASAVLVTPNGDLFASGPHGVARRTGTSWAMMGPVFLGFNGTATAMTVLTNGDLVIGGNFMTSGFSRSIARWNGSSWSDLAGGVIGRVHALTALPNGDLVAAGDFTSAGGVPVNRIARWNGTVWSPMGTGMDGTVVSALATLQNGDVVAGGDFTTAGGVAASRIARWNGSAWSAMGTGMDLPVRSLLVRSNGVLVAGGDFQSAGVSARCVAEWNGTAWSALGSGMNGNNNWGGPAVFALASLPNGEIVAGGSFLAASGGNAQNLARWNGTTWAAVGPGMNLYVQALLALPNGDVVAGGEFTGAGGVVANHVARWNGTNWSALGSGTNGRVCALARLANGDLVVGGQFTSAGGATANNIARWDGTTWSALGAGMSGPFPIVYALACRPNGDLIAGGQFTAAGGTSASNIARWDGTAWSPLGSGTSSTAPLTPGQVQALLTMPNGDLVACGGFNTAGGVSASHIARWNGVLWSALGSGTDLALYALATNRDGDLLAGGAMDVAGGVPAYRIARWDGSVWSPIGTSFFAIVRAIVTLPDGDIVLGGDQPAHRWDGVTSTPIALGYSTAWQQPAVSALATLPNGDLVAGGSFHTAGSAVSAYFARLTTTCPATAIANGAGCTGNLLIATSLPWTGSSFRSLATGLPSQSLAINVVGFSTASTPLNTLLPQGVAGCTLLVNPMATLFAVPTNGSLAMQIAIPNSATFAGVVLHQQVLPFALDALGNVTAFTGTNALTLTVGTF